MYIDRHYGVHCKYRPELFQLHVILARWPRLLTLCAPWVSKILGFLGAGSGAGGRLRQVGLHKSHRHTSIPAASLACLTSQSFLIGFIWDRKVFLLLVKKKKKKKVWKPPPNFKFPLMLRKLKPREGRRCTEVHTAGKLQSPAVACTTHSVVLLVILETFCAGSPSRQHLHSGFQGCFPLTWKLAWNHSPLAKCLLCAPSSLTCSLSKLLAECLGQGAL